MTTKVVKTNYSHKRTVLNPNYREGIIEKDTLRSCLIHNKSDKKIEIETSPKWYTTLNYNELQIDEETGEVIHLTNELYETDSHKAANNRKIKTLMSFCTYFEPLYKKHKVTMLFFTLTQANEALTDIKGVINTLKHRAARQGTKLSYFWTKEVSFEKDKTGHIHYHLAVAIPRIRVKGGKLPEWLKLDNVWGRRTQVAFVKKSIRGYMMKYFSKHSARTIGSRMYGISKGFFALPDNDKLN